MILDALPPDVHVWRSGRVSWFETADELPRYVRFKFEGIQENAHPQVSILMRSWPRGAVSCRIFGGKGGSPYDSSRLPSASQISFLTSSMEWLVTVES